ncbi:MAG: 1-acyl-sn-glycerol-3-phosphate acyltransferase [Spirochaetaceae bacterium]|nr:1-acyl-sn-glycerol-3-phosphate acyltransferase [Spirochaetaceae bacterium]
MNKHENLSTVFIPQTGIDYPEIPDQPILTPKKLREVVFDENYPYLDKSFGAKLRNVAIYAGIFVLVFPLQKIRYGLKVVGRKNITKNKKLFKNGALTVCNHVYRWDFLAVLQAARFRRIWFPARPDNIQGSDAGLIRSTGGIPIPSTISASRKFNQAFDELHERKKWIHVFPEACRWDFYQPIRPFKKGAFTMAVRYGIPVVPMVISYRNPKDSWFHKLIGTKHPLITINVGEPLVVNPDLSRKEATNWLREKSHAKMCEMAGIVKNYWPVEGD